MKSPLPLAALAIILALYSCTGPGSAPTTAPRPRPPDPYRQIADSILATGTLSSVDRQFLIGAASDLRGEFGQRHKAIITLQIAASRKAFPMADLLALIEQNAISSDGTETKLYASEYWNCLKLPVKGRSQFYAKADELSNKKLPPNTLSPYEIAFLKAALSTTDMRDRGIGANLLLAKKDLDAKSKMVAGTHIKTQLAALKGSELEFWKFVDRVVAARN